MATTPSGALQVPHDIETSDRALRAYALGLAEKRHLGVDARRIAVEHEAYIRTGRA